MKSYAKILPFFSTELVIWQYGLSSAREVYFGQKNFRVEVKEKIENAVYGHPIKDL